MGSVAVIGGGPCGFSATANLAASGIRATMFEISNELAKGTPFSSNKLGAQAMSFNSAEPRVGKVLNRLTRNKNNERNELLHLDDGLLSAGILSRTKEVRGGMSGVG